MSTIATDDIDAPVAAHQHLVPSKHCIVRERGIEIFVEIDHHFRDAAFRGRHRTAVLAQTELPLQGRLDAVAVENFAFNLRSLERFIAYELDFEGVLILGANMLEGADELARAQQKVTLQRLQSLGIVSEIRPLRILPVPSHEL